MSSQRVEGTATAPEPQSKNSPTSEEAFTVLSNQRRRYALHYLLQREGATVEVRDLAEQIAAWEHDIDVESVNYDERRNVYTALKQSHLPKLSSAAFIEYDKSRGTVTATGASSDLDIYLDVVSDKTIPWSQFYLGLGIVSVGLTACRVIELPLFDAIPLLGWASGVSVLFLVTSIAHLQYERTRKLGADGPPPELKEGTHE